MTQSDSSNFIVADDHPLFREALIHAIHNCVPGAVIHEADSLASLIRLRLVPERWNPVTDFRHGISDNAADGIPTQTLFEGLEMAENLREQLGRGINIELALKSLLLGLEPMDADRVVT